jgi:hypothetical protein
MPLSAEPVGHEEENEDEENYRPDSQEKKYSDRLTPPTILSTPLTVVFYRAQGSFQNTGAAESP